MMGCDGEDTFPGLTSIVCSLCKSESAITDPESAEIVCTKCGMVISDKIEQTRHTLDRTQRSELCQPLWLVMTGYIH
jgi:transcription initiation factor TFIIIB Brf1 subunit/transcription initiation factor TFIIB